MKPGAMEIGSVERELNVGGVWAIAQVQAIADDWKVVTRYKKAKKEKEKCTEIEAKKEEEKCTKIEAKKEKEECTKIEARKEEEKSN